MFARISLLLPLLVSLLFAGPMAPAAREVVRRDPGACVAMACVKGCCTSSGCCQSARQEQAPKSPAPLAPQPEWQLVAPGLEIFAVAVVRAARTWHFITDDERSGAHALPPLTQSCIQLI